MESRRRLETEVKRKDEMASRLKILLIEDDDDFAAVLATLLKNRGYDPIRAPNGAEGLRKARTCRPDLILLDIMLPDKDGYSVCRELKEDPKIGKTPVLILSAIGNPESEKRFMNEIARHHHADGFLDKPVQDHELLRAIDGLLERGWTEVRSPHAKRRILLVDDDPDFLSAVEQMLKPRGFEIFVAENGIEALKMAYAFHPDVVLLDVMLPGKDGYTVCQELKANPDTHGTHVILVSAIGEVLSAPGYAAHIAFDHGADDFISKPIETEELLSKVEETIRE